MKKLPLLLLNLALATIANSEEPAKTKPAAEPPLPVIRDKTLVAWVAPSEQVKFGGSVLTIDDGQSHFDGIVLGELAPKKWMAGSDILSRTQRNQAGSAEETADAKTFVQIAITYKGKDITIYRNGQVYAQYNAGNGPLEFDAQSAVTIGMRHLDQRDSARFAGAIDDARIYSQALSAEQIAALKPNESSDLKPVAWWTFDDDKATDRAGRFKAVKLEGGAKVEAGRLLLDGKDATMIATTGKVYPVTYEQLTVPANRPSTWLTYHLAHPGPRGAFPGDPNPAFFYKGRYHLHYIYEHKEGFAFAHVSSTDMVRWQWHPTTLSPKNTGHGMFSGTGFLTKEGQPAMIYHGFGSGKNQIALALDDNLEQWAKPIPLNPLMPNGQKPTFNSWDPDCWLNNGTYYAIGGGKDPKLMKSDDLKNWVYLGELFHKDFPADIGVPKGEDVSCANMFKLGDKWMLLCISHALGARYYLGDFKDEKYLPTHHAMMNWARWDTFAPESLLTEDGRRVMWAWCTAGQNGRQKVGRKKDFPSLLNLAKFQAGIQCLPRELSLSEDGMLRIKPLRELESLRDEKKVVKDLTVKGDSIHLLDDIKGDTIELEVIISAPQAKEFGINLLCDEKGENGFPISTGTGAKTLTVDYVNPPFELKPNEDLTLRIFIDKSMIEVFVNDRQATVAWHEYSPENLRVSLFSKGGDIVVKQLTAWKMKSIYEGNCVFGSK